MSDIKHIAQHEYLKELKKLPTENLHPILSTLLDREIKRVSRWLAVKGNPSQCHK